MFTIEFLRRDGDAVVVAERTPGHDSNFDKVIALAEGLLESDRFRKGAVQGFRIVNEEGETIVTSWIRSGQFRR